MNTLVRKVVALRSESMDAQRTLEEIDLRGREKRAQLGFAVDQLGTDGSKSKEDLRSARDAQKHAEDECKLARERFLEVHKEVVIWEGRSGFLEPWPDLAQAYRAVRRLGRRVGGLPRGGEALAGDFRGRRARRQRSRLPDPRAPCSARKHEQDLDDEREKCREAIHKNGNEADTLESQLLELTTRFCNPLRARPELAPLFRELEIEAEGPPPERAGSSRP